MGAIKNPGLWPGQVVGVVASRFHLLDDKRSTGEFTSQAVCVQLCPVLGLEGLSIFDRFDDLQFVASDRAADRVRHPASEISERRIIRFIADLNDPLAHW